MTSIAERWLGKPSDGVLERIHTNSTDRVPSLMTSKAAATTLSRHYQAPHWTLILRSDAAAAHSP